MSRRLTLILIAIIAMAGECLAQEASQNTGVRRRDASDAPQSSSVDVSSRAQSFYGTNGTVSDADVQWMKVIYRQLDLMDDKNVALYFPEDPIDGQENLFRIIMRLLCNGQVSAYDYLDGREIFTDKYKVKMGDVFERFHIPFTEAKGSTEKAPKYEIDESDVPTNEVLSYYIIERWEYDTRANRMRSYVDAICPILHRVGDFGGDAVRYPMFWVKFADLRPYLAHQQIFVSDDNNLPTCNYDDFFNLSMYNGEIYKTRNLKNQTLMQLYPEPDDLKRAQDSIQAYLDNFDRKLWVPDREDVIASRDSKAKEKAESKPSLDDVVAAPDTSTGEVESAPQPAVKENKPARSTRRSSARPKKQSRPAQSSGSAARSVRRKR